MRKNGRPEGAPRIDEVGSVSNDRFGWVRPKRSVPRSISDNRSFDDSSVRFSRPI